MPRGNHFKGNTPRDRGAHSSTPAQYGGAHSDDSAYTDSSAYAEASASGIASRVRGASHSNAPKGKKKHRGRNVLFVIGGSLLACITAFMVFCLVGLPSVSDAEKYNQTDTTTIYASDGETVLAELYLKNRKPIELEDVSQNVINATIDTEDERFYSHMGVDPIGIARALFNNVTGSSGLQGASTINQQFVRNTLIADEMSEISIKRKVREAFLAVMLNAQYSKDEILNMYLNTINYGDNCYGIEAAAQHYYSKSASELTVPEAAALAGIPQSPTAHTPTVYPENCLERRNEVLGRMLACGHITQEEYDEYCSQDLGLDVTWPKSNGIKKYPYFATYVRDMLLEELGTDSVYEGGLTVITTLNVKDQKAAEKACKAQYSSLADDAEIALVSIDPDTGQIVSMVGGKSFKADQYNLVTQAQRQPGSSFKTFTLLACIEAGINPKTVIDCTSPITLRVGGDGSNADESNGTYSLDNGTLWKVENINNANYGHRSIQSAFAVSSNTGFARMVQVVGADKVVDMAHRCGITSDLEAVDSITLGSQAVTPLEMAEAFATIASGGIHRTSTAIISVTDLDGNVVYEPEVTEERVLDEKVACAALNVMKTVFTQGTATYASLSNGQEAAGKTGTSEEYRDHWLCGVTPQLSTVVWIGCRQERSLYGVDCCYVWRTYMNAALEGLPVESFPTAAEPAYNHPFNSKSLAESSSSSKKKSKSKSSSSSQTQSSSSSQQPTSSSGSSSSSSSVIPDPEPVPEPEPEPEPVPEPEPDPGVEGHAE